MQTIKKNSKGNLVKYLKKNLTSLGYTLSATDVFDAGTESAVKKFQASKNLSVDGVVGKNTWTEIYMSTVSPRITNSRVERNDNVRLLHPTVRKAVVATYVQLQAEGIPFAVFEAYRFPQRQASLYAQGRTTPGGIVTYAKPWSSYHQFGLAVDFVLYVNGKWSWSTSTKTEKEWWKKLHEVGAAEGLMKLDFEAPHLQLAGTSSNALREGLYPADGDESWVENFNAAIIGWKGSPAAPPRAQHDSIRPEL